MQTNLLPIETGVGHGEKELVERIRQGDERAIRIMVQQHNRRLFRIARAIVKNDAEAEDVVQETYVRAFTSLGLFAASRRCSPGSRGSRSTRLWPAQAQPTCPPAR